MPPKSRASGESKTTSKRRMPEKDTEEYKKRRERNNVAVKRSRNKTRQKAKDTVEKINKLRQENEDLEQQVKILSKELGVLKDLFKMAHANTLTMECASSQTSAVPDTEDLGAICDKVTADGAPADPEVNKEAVQKDHEYSAASPPWS